MGKRKDRYTVVVGYWKGMWHTDKAAYVARGETDMVCEVCFYDVVSERTELEILIFGLETVEVIAQVVAPT